MWPTTFRRLALVRRAMLDYGRVLFRHDAPMRQDLAQLNAAWRDIAASGPGLRELAGMVASARWSLVAALARRESRGIHQRTDHPETDPALARRIRLRGLRHPRATPEPALEAAA